MQDNGILNKDNEEQGLDIKKILGYLRTYWVLIAVSVLLCLSAAVFYLMRATTVYNVTAKVLLQDSEKGGAVISPADMLADFGMRGAKSNIENEIELMSSLSVLRAAVLSADLHVRYYRDGNMMYKAASPIAVSMEQDVLDLLEKPLMLEVELGKDGSAKVAVAYDKMELPAQKVASLPCLFETPAGPVTIALNEAFETPKKDEADVEEQQNIIMAQIAPVYNVVDMYKKKLAIAPLSKTSSVAALSYNTSVPGEGIDFLNAVMECFNNKSNDNKRQVALRTEEFISERLDTLRLELETMESSLAAYKKSNEIIDPKLDATQVSKDKAEYIKLLEQIDLKIETARFLGDYVNNPENDMQVIPASFGITLDPSLVALINNYNGKVLERKALLQTVTAENPALKNLTVMVTSMQADLRLALNALAKSLDIERRSVAILVDQYTGRFEMSPEVERQLLSITRECTIKSELYVMLLQKYEETLLSIEVSSDNLSCIDEPHCTGPVAPNKKMILMVAMFFGLLIPAAIIYIREMMRNRFATTEEVQAALPMIPFVGSVPVMKNAKNVAPRSIVVEKNKNDVMAEAFRTMRTNLNFVMRNEESKVVMFTSTVSGEGKTFVASNLAVSTVLLGKKVLLVGCDIRRPRLAEVFNFSSTRQGLTSYLSAPEDQVSMLDDLIVPSKVVEGLDVLAAGIVPPNPAEQLSSKNFERAISYLKEKYDLVLLDAAPVGLVADSMIVARVADVVAYVVRLDYTYKADAGFIKSLLEEKKLENMVVVVNGDNLEKKSYGSRGTNRYSSYSYSYISGEGGKKG